MYNLIPIVIPIVEKFRFNSIQAPAIYGYEKVQDGYRFLQFKERETLEETLAFWGTHKPHEV